MMTTPQNTEAAAATATSPTGTEARVCADITRRQALGLAKYGTTVEANPLPLPAWLQHAYEETLDQAIYLRRAMEEIAAPQGSQAPAEDERAEFEAWAIKEGYPTDFTLDAECGVEGGGVYADSRTHAAWWAYRAGRATQPQPKGTGTSRALQSAVQRALSAWDTTTLKTNGDGMLFEAMDSLRAEFDGAVEAPAPAPEVPQGPRTEFVLNELRSSLNAMTTFFGMDEDEDSKPTFDKARQALNYAEIVMRPLEPWERQSLEDSRACVHRWHEKAVAKGYDGVEAMCDTALPYGTRDLRLVSASPAVKAEPLTELQMRLERQRIDPVAEDMDSWSFEQGVRFAERAHGIGKSNPPVQHKEGA